jgi:hypothetical protein
VDGDAYDNALAETTSGLFKTEAVGRGSPFLAGPLRTIQDRLPREGVGRSSQSACFGKQTATGPGSSAYTSRTALLTKERRPKHERPGYQSRMMAR